MVERDYRNTLRGHWRDQSEQCRADHRSRGGFYRRIVGSMGLRKWSEFGRTAAVSALLAVSILTTPLSYSQDTSLWAPQTTMDPSLSEAVSAYELKDFTRALSLAKSAASTGNSDAQVMVAHILLRGEAGIIDHTLAAEYYRKAAEQQNSDAYMGLGEMSLRSLAGLTPSDAMHWFSAASQTGRRGAMRAIGEMYMKGQGIAPDAEKAKAWLDRAAEYGDGLADRKMADSLFESNPVEALKYYEKAAKSGDNEAAYIAAIMYNENLEVRPNSKRMVELMRQAAESGHAAAQADYGLFVYQGRGVAKDQNAAVRWFEKSARGGDGEGQFLYAFTLAKGEGVAQNYEEAYYWLLKSGQSGVDDYDKDKAELKKRLEANVDPAILERARARAR